MCFSQAQFAVLCRVFSKRSVAASVDPVRSKQEKGSWAVEHGQMILEYWVQLYLIDSKYRLDMFMNWLLQLRVEAVVTVVRNSSSSSPIVLSGLLTVNGTSVSTTTLQLNVISTVDPIEYPNIWVSVYQCCCSIYILYYYYCLIEMRW